MVCNYVFIIYIFICKLYVFHIIMCVYMAQLAQRSWRCFIPGSIQGQDGQGLPTPGLVMDNLLADGECAGTHLIRNRKNFTD